MIEFLFVLLYFRRFIVAPLLHTEEIRFIDFLNLMFQRLHDFPLLSQEYAWVVLLFIEASSIFIKILIVEIDIFVQYSSVKNLFF